MGTSANDPDDPFRTDRPPATTPTQPAPRGPRPDPQPDETPTPEVKARSVRLAVVAVAAVAASFFAAPAGAVLGVITLVLAARAAPGTPPRARTLAFVAGGIAVVVGLLITAVGLTFRTEISDYTRCMQGANTLQARTACQDSLTDSLAERLGR